MHSPISSTSNGKRVNLLWHVWTHLYLTYPAHLAHVYIRVNSYTHLHPPILVHMTLHVQIVDRRLLLASTMYIAIISSIRGVWGHVKSKNFRSIRHLYPMKRLAPITTPYLLTFLFYNLFNNLFFINYIFHIIRHSTVLRLNDRPYALLLSRVGAIC